MKIKTQESQFSLNENKDLSKLLDIKLQELPLEKRKKFKQELINCLYWRAWCDGNKINYAEPDMNQAKIIVYNEMFGNQ